MHICTGLRITYSNGACVSTSFATNLEPPGIRTDSRLRKMVEEVDAENKKQYRKLKEVTKWDYPRELVTAAQMDYLSQYGVDISFDLEELHRVNKLDNQPKKKSIYGGGFLLSPSAADRLAEAKAEAKAEAEERKRRRFGDPDGIKVELSERERKMIGLE